MQVVCDRCEGPEPARRCKFMRRLPWSKGLSTAVHRRSVVGRIRRL